MKIATAVSQCRHRNAILHHLTYRARIVPQLSPAEDQKQCREKKTRRENDRIVDVVYHNATVAPFVSAKSKQRYAARHQVHC